MTLWKTISFTLPAKLTGRPANFNAGGTFSTGLRAWDRMLPRGGWERGQLTECICDGAACGGTLLALLVARQAAFSGGMVLVVDRQGCFYPPAAAALGMDMRRLVVIRPRSQLDEAWAIDQGLRAAGVAAVLAWPDAIHDHTFRRWQLAAESQRVTGLLVRSAVHAREPSWAALRLRVQTLPSETLTRRRVHVELLRARGDFAKGSLVMDLDPITGTLYESNSLCAAAVGS